jgi:hypothetical protein
MTRLAGGVLLLLLSLGVVSHAQAQISPFRGKGPKLQPSDLSLMDAAATPLFEGADFSPGTARTWSNDKTGASGTVTLLGSATFQGLSCRQLRYDVTVPPRPSAPYRIDWCQTKDGTWKMR